MAEGALSRSRAQIAVAVTGVAGPGGGTPGKPVGLVWFGIAGRGPLGAESRIFSGDREAVRIASIAHAFALIRTRV
jgi:nicotinamide-nucleotide amidase